MDASMLHGSQSSAVDSLLAGRLISPAEFRKLLISHRRLVRADQRPDRLKGLRDLDTGEVFLTDERRLLEAWK